MDVLADPPAHSPCLVEHQKDIIIAAVLAAVFAVVIEMLKPLFRRLTSVVTAKTVPQLDKRIKQQLEFRRIITNDKAFYLSVLRAVLGVLSLVSSGLAVDSIGFQPLGSIIYLFAAAIALNVMRTALLDSDEKRDARLKKIDAKVVALRAQREELIAKQKK